MDDLTGQYIGRYHIIEKLGRGGMAEVYRAFDTRLERDVAVKFIRRDAVPQSSWANMLKRFEREAKTLARLSFPNIVQVHDYGEHENIPYVVMEYIRGGTLKQRLGQPIPYTQAAGLLLPIARALEFAHQNGIIHRDVKPANILITEAGVPMLSDFGIAKILDLDQGTALTGTGVGIGTPDYMAPEQWTGEADQRSDIYSLGIILFELITGQRPYIADTPPAVLLKHVNDPLPRPASMVPGLPAAVEQVIYKALAKKPVERYQEMGEFAAALEKLIEMGSPSKAAAAAAAQRWASAARATPEPYLPAQTPTATRPSRGAKDQVEPSPSAQKPKANSLVYLLGGAGIALLGIFAIGALVAAYLLLIKPRQESSLANTLPPQTPAIVSTALKEATLTPEIAAASDTPALSPTLTFTLPPASTETSTPSPPTLIPTKTSTVPVRLVAGATKVSAKDGMILVYVPEGNFIMGSEFGSDEEKPPHSVYLNAFWIDQTEVTNAMFARFVVETGYRTDAETRGKAWVWINDDWDDVEGADWKHPRGPSTDIIGLDDHPVVQVSWNDAVAYCTWAGRRLPTEAEWEKAAEGEQDRIFPWGDTAVRGDLVNLADVNIDLKYSNKDINDGYTYTAPVGSYPAGASPYGILDMAGNVYEWVQDWYSETYYSESPERNPTGPEKDDTIKYKVIRGGSYFTAQGSVMTFERDNRVPALGLAYLGIRCAVSP